MHGKSFAACARVPQWMELRVETESCVPWCNTLVPCSLTQYTVDADTATSKIKALPLGCPESRALLTAQRRRLAACLRSEINWYFGLFVRKWRLCENAPATVPVRPWYYWSTRTIVCSAFDSVVALVIVLRSGCVRGRAVQRHTRAAHWVRC